VRIEMVRKLVRRLRLRRPALAEDTIVIDDEEFERLFEDDGDSARRHGERAGVRRRIEERMRDYPLSDNCLRMEN
jgi:hypothetical protein